MTRAPHDTTITPVAFDTVTGRPEVEGLHAVKSGRRITKVGYGGNDPLLIDMVPSAQQGFVNGSNIGMRANEYDLARFVDHFHALYTGIPGSNPGSTIAGDPAEGLFPNPALVMTDVPAVIGTNNGFPAVGCPADGKPTLTLTCDPMTFYNGPSLSGTGLGISFSQSGGPTTPGSSVEFTAGGTGGNGYYRGKAWLKDIVEFTDTTVTVLLSTVQNKVPWDFTLQHNPDAAAGKPATVQISWRTGDVFPYSLLQPWHHHCANCIDSGLYALQAYNNYFVQGVLADGITGVTLNLVSPQNGVGTGTLTAVDADKLTWKAPGDSACGEPATVTEPGVPVIITSGDPKKYIVVTCSALSLSGTTTITTTRGSGMVVSGTNWCAAWASKPSGAKYFAPACNQTTCSQYKACDQSRGSFMPASDYARYIFGRGGIPYTKIVPGRPQTVYVGWEPTIPGVFAHCGLDLGYNAFNATVSKQFALPDSNLCVAIVDGDYNITGRVPCDFYNVTPTNFSKKDPLTGEPWTEDAFPLRHCGSVSGASFGRPAFYGGDDDVQTVVTSQRETEDITLASGSNLTSVIGEEIAVSGTWNAETSAFDFVVSESRYDEFLTDNLNRDKGNCAATISSLSGDVLTVDFDLGTVEIQENATVEEPSGEVNQHSTGGNAVQMPVTKFISNPAGSNGPGSEPPADEQQKCWRGDACKIIIGADTIYGVCTLATAFGGSTETSPAHPLVAGSIGVPGSRVGLANKDRAIFQLEPGATGKLAAWQTANPSTKITVSWFRAGVHVYNALPAISLMRSADNTVALTIAPENITSYFVRGIFNFSVSGIPDGAYYLRIAGKRYHIKRGTRCLGNGVQLLPLWMNKVANWTVCIPTKYDNGVSYLLGGSEFNFYGDAWESADASGESEWYSYTEYSYVGTRFWGNGTRYGGRTESFTIIATPIIPVGFQKDLLGMFHGGILQYGGMAPGSYTRTTYTAATNSTVTETVASPYTWRLALVIMEKVLYSPPNETPHYEYITTDVLQEWDIPPGESISGTIPWAAPAVGENQMICFVIDCPDLDIDVKIPPSLTDKICIKTYAGTELINGAEVPIYDWVGKSFSEGRGGGRWTATFRFPENEGRQMFANPDAIMADAPQLFGVDTHTRFPSAASMQAIKQD